MDARDLSLEPITPARYAEALELRVRPEQEHLIATVQKSLADAYVYEGAIFRLAVEGDALVGYVLVYPFEEDGVRTVNIARLMVDQQHQGRGLGRALLQHTVRWVEGFEPQPDRVRISTLPENEGALHLYRAEGFEDAGIEEGEIALYRSV